MQVLKVKCKRLQVVLWQVVRSYRLFFMNRIVGYTFVLFVTLFISLHLLFNIDVQLNNFFWKDAILSLIFNFGVEGIVFAFVTVVVTMTPSQYLIKRYSLQNAVFRGLYYVLTVISSTYFLWWAGEMNNHLDGIDLYPRGLEYYKSLNTIDRIEVLSNYLIVLTTAIFFDIRLRKITANSSLA